MNKNKKSELDLNESLGERRDGDEAGDSVIPLNNDSKTYHDLINENKEKNEYSELNKKLLLLERKIESITRKQFFLINYICS